MTNCQKKKKKKEKIIIYIYIYIYIYIFGTFVPNLLEHYEQYAWRFVNKWMHVGTSDDHTLPHIL